MRSIALWIASALAAAAVPLDEELLALAGDESAVARGEEVYNQLCFACHGMQLEGAAGPNLRDAVWVHGGAPSKILEVINKGVSEKGMMAYEEVFDDSTRKALVAFILARQEGLRGLRYAVFPALNDPLVELAEAPVEAVKTGVIEDAVIDLSPAEMRDFSMVWEGEFLAPVDGRYRFRSNHRGAMAVISMNGEELARGADKLEAAIELKAGRHRFGYAFQRTDETPKALFVDYRYERPGGAKVEAPLSRDSRQQLMSRRQEFLVTDEPLVVRSVLPEIPGESVAVGLPGGLSLALGRGGAVHAAWAGAFLDIGPNVTGRGQKSAVIPEPWFRSEPGIELVAGGEAVPLRLVEYERSGGEVVFRFGAPGGQLELRPAVVENRLALDYRVDAAALGGIGLRLPEGVAIESEDGALEDGVFQPADGNSFRIFLSP